MWRDDPVAFPSHFQSSLVHGHNPQPVSVSFCMMVLSLFCEIATKYTDAPSRSVALRKGKQNTLLCATCAAFESILNLNAGSGIKNYGLFNSKHDYIFCLHKSSSRKLPMNVLTFPVQLSKLHRGPQSHARRSHRQAMVGETGVHLPRVSRTVSHSSVRFPYTSCDDLYLCFCAAELPRLFLKQYLGLTCEFVTVSRWRIVRTTSCI